MFRFFWRNVMAIPIYSAITQWYLNTLKICMDSEKELVFVYFSGTSSSVWPLNVVAPYSELRLSPASSALFFFRILAWWQVLTQLHGFNYCPYTDNSCDYISSLYFFPELNLGVYWASWNYMSKTETFLVPFCSALPTALLFMSQFLPTMLPPFN